MGTVYDIKQIDTWKRYSFNLLPFSIPLYKEEKTTNGEFIMKMCHFSNIPCCFKMQKTIEIHEWCHAVWSYLFPWLVFIHVQYTSTKPPQYIAMIKFATNTSSSWWIFYSLWFGLQFYFISVFPFIVNKNVMNYSECSVLFLLGHINIILIKWVLNIDELNGLCRNWITNWNQNKLKSWFLFNIKFVYCAIWYYFLCKVLFISVI